MMKTITIKVPMMEEVEFGIGLHPEDTHPRDCFDSGDEEVDKKDVAKILKDLEWNPWAWCVVEVRATWRGLSEHAYLGGCSYANEEDFKSCVYYEDLKCEAYERLIKKIHSLAD